MIFDFQSLLDKVKQLAEMAQTLRGENAALRREIAALAEQNTRLEQRMQEAHDRVAKLIDRLPGADADREAA
ncbi:MAG: DUF904 domain-containing protein [Oxalobacteraceae bacterium]|jgi:cell division protein ZapB|nr:DUF904 domain-containing protein [Oxalobacteraceae bacterium]